MPRDRSTRRLTPSHPEAPASAARSLASILARAERLTDLLPQLHQRAIETTGAACSLLFQHNPRTGALHATSGYGLDTLQTDPWTASESEDRFLDEAFREGLPTLVPDLERQMPELCVRLGAPAALLVPLARGADRVGLLTVGFRDLAAAGRLDYDVADVRDALLLTLELFRLRQNDELHGEVRDLIDQFTTALDAPPGITAALERLAIGANRLFAANRTSVWIHDRRSRQLVLQASSEPGPSPGMHLSVDDPFAPAALALRSIRSQLAQGSVDGEADSLTVPLRGCRRALGALVFEGVRIEGGGELDLLDRADQLGREVSNAIETLQFLAEVVRARREVEDIFNAITHVVAVTDTAGRIIHTNEAFAARLGLPRDQLVDRFLTACVGHELASWIEAAAIGAEDSRVGAAEREIVDSVLGGPLLVHLSDLVDHDRRVVGRVLMGREPASPLTLEAEREELKQQLAQAEKLAALGQFVAGVAHELNNPLQTVMGNLELIRMNGLAPASLHSDLAVIYSEAERAAQVVRNLTAFSGTRPLARQPLNIAALLEQVTSSRQTACRARNIEIVRHYDQNLRRVTGDALLLQQVFLNIILNAEQAVAATGQPGRIEVRADPGGQEQVVVTVRDTGHGIPVGAMSRLFEPFYTTREAGDGTGLGLAIAYGVVQDHGGHLSAANHPNGGAIFTVELPAGQAS